MVRERPDLKQYEGRKLTVIAWLWARTVKSPNPAFADVDVPLVSTWMLSTKKGKEAYVEPVVQGREYRFEVRARAPEDLAAAKAGTKLSRGVFRCLFSGVAMAGDHIKAEGQAKRMGSRLMAIVAEGDRRRVYLNPTAEHVGASLDGRPEWFPEVCVPARLTGGTCVPYGLSTWADLFTPRQLVALTTFSDLVGEAINQARRDAMTAGLLDDGQPLRDGGMGALAYAEAVGLYLALAVSKTSNVSSSITSWMSDRGAFRETFARQAIPMVWDFAEANSFAGLGGSFDAAIAKGAMAIETLPAQKSAWSKQMDAASQASAAGKVVSTDPPYYDNIGYADLSDYFYVWLRRSVPFVFPSLFSTLAVPKSEELVATPYRHGGKAAAETFFLAGMTRAMRRLAEQAHIGFPITVYYAFKQSERRGDSGATSTGWETFLGALIESGLSVTGTWPMRTEGAGRILAKGANALASSIVLVCRPRSADAPLATRREFLSALRAELPHAVHLLQTGNVAPVDLAQAAIGPGMAVYTRYERSRGAALRGRCGRGVTAGLLRLAPPIRVYSNRRPLAGVCAVKDHCAERQGAAWRSRQAVGGFDDHRRLLEGVRGNGE